MHRVEIHDSLGHVVDAFIGHNIEELKEKAHKHAKKGETVREVRCNNHGQYSPE